MMMMNHTCSSSGKLDSTNFSRPMPVIGMYIAAASACCFLFMALDIYTSFRTRLRWIRCKFFRLNAFTLTLLGVAAKLPLDLNTAMPGPHHQLTKISGTVLLCMAMGFTMPSLAAMEDPEIISNMVALNILVITVAVNTCIQIGTGAIFAFLPEHILVLCIMLVLLLLMSTVNSITPLEKIKREAAEALSKQRESFAAQNASLDDMSNPQKKFNHCKEALPVVWELTSQHNPQNYVSRQPHGCSAGILSLLSAVVLLETEIRSFIDLRSTREFFLGHFCKGDSEYGRSVLIILIVQSFVVILASLAISVRVLNGIDFWNPIQYITIGVVPHLSVFTNVQWHCVPPHFQNVVDCRDVAWQWFGNLTVVLHGFLIQMIIIITHFVCFLLSMVPFLLFCCFKGSKGNQGGTDVGGGGGGRGSGCVSCTATSAHQVDAWIQRGIAHGTLQTAHLVKLITTALCNESGVLLDRDRERDPVWFHFHRHIKENEGCCDLFLATIVHMCKSLFMGSKPSEVRDLVAAVKEGRRLLLLVDKWVFDKQRTRGAARMAAKLMWREIQARHFGRRVDAAMPNSNAENISQRVAEDLKVTCTKVTSEMFSYFFGQTSVWDRQVKDLCDGIPLNNTDFEWFRQRIAKLTVYCLSTILDMNLVFNLQAESVREVAQMLGTI